MVQRRPGATRLLGRTAELALLEEELARLRSGQTAGVVITGEPGIGKSRLVDELRERATAEGAVVAIGHTAPGGDGLPYGTIVSLIRDLSRRLDSEAAARVAEAHRHLLGGDDDAGTPGRIARLTLFEEVLGTVGRLASVQPLMLVVEDLHWADAGSVGMFDHLVRNLGDAPLLLVATYRPGDVDIAVSTRRALAELRSSRTTRSIELSGLGRDDIALLLADVTGTTPAWTVVDAIHRRSEGNPLFAEELVAVTDHSGLPPALADLLSVKIDALGPAARRVVAAAAVLGMSVDHEALTDIVALSDEELDAGAGEAVRAGVLAHDSRTGDLRFRHPLLHEVAYAGVVPTERARLHGRAADTIEAGRRHLSRLDLAALADHRHRARQWAPACIASLAAGNASLDVHEVHAAHAHFTRAVDAHDRAAGSCTHAERETDILGQAAAAAYVNGEYDRSMLLAERALALLDPTVTPEAAAAVATTFALAAAGGGHDARGLQLIRTLTEGLASRDSIAARAELASTEARILMANGHLPESTELAKSALVLAREAGQRIIEGHCLATLAPNLADRGAFEDAIAAAEEAVAIADETGDVNLLIRAWTNHTDVHLTAGRYEQVAAVAVATMDGGDPAAALRLGGTGHNGAEALMILGRWDEAERLFRIADALVVSTCLWAGGLSALLRLRRGELDAAEGVLGSQIATSTWSRIVHPSMRAELALEREDVDGCLGQVDEALAAAAGCTGFRLEILRAHAVGLRALAERAASERQSRRDSSQLSKTVLLADTMLTEVERMLREATPERGAPSPALRASAALCRAEASRVDGEDPSAWATAAAEFESLRDPYHQAYCSFREAEARLGRRSDRRTATATLSSAWRTAQHLGARGLSARCERLAERANIRLADPDGPDASPRARLGADLGLTPREVEVFERLAQNCTDGEIADELFISKKTASVHVSNILRKLDVPDRRRAGTLAREVGLGVTPQEPVLR